MWKPRDPDVFGQAVRPWSSSTSRATSATSTIWRQSHARHRVEVDPQLVGVGEVVGAHRVRIEVDAAEVDRPHQAGGIVDDGLLGRGAGRVLQLGDVDEVRPLLGRPLLEDGLLGDALDEPLEDHRPVPHSAQRALGDGEVVVDQVELGDARHRGKTTLSGWVMGTCATAHRPASSEAAISSS